MKLPNFLKGFSIKSVAHHDQFYVDDEGKHVIFRTIRGKVVPIKTTAEEYAEWLIKQGVNVDPADQKQLRALEEELEILERAGEAGGPELQQQYEKAFSQQKQQYSQMVQQMYQQAIEAQSQKTGVAPERIQESRKKQFEEAKDRTVKRKEMADRGWDSFIESYVGEMINAAGFQEKSGQWYVMQAYDLMLRKAREAAQQGVDPTTFDLDKAVSDELSGYSGLTRHGDHYAQYKASDEDYSVEANMFRAVQWLKDNLAVENESSDFMRGAFDEIYSRMYEDFNPEAREEFERLPDAINVPRDVIPKELPPTYGAREAASLMGVYRSAKGSKLGAAHTVAMHSIARLYDSIPSDERVAAIAELSDASRGVHAIHQSKYRGVYHDKEQFGIEVNVERELEEILRAATRASDGTTRDRVQAIKEIAGKLGLIHGAHTLAAMGDNPSLVKYRNRWQDASLNAGKRKGDGPNIIDTLIDDDRLSAAMLTNATLKVPHTRANAERPSGEIKVPEKVAKKPKEKVEGVAVPPAFTRDGKSFVTEEGYRVTPGKDQWSVSSPDGEEIGSVFIEPGSASQKEAKLAKALKEAETVIQKYKTGGEEKAVVAPSAMFGFKGAPLSNKDKDNLDKLAAEVKSKGLALKEKAQGVLYEISGTGVMVGYRKSDGSVKFLDSATRKPIESFDEVLGRLSGEAQEPEAPAQESIGPATTEEQKKNFQEVSSPESIQQFIAAREKLGDSGLFIDKHTPESLQQIIDGGGKVYMNPHGAGYIVTGEGNLEGVFNTGETKGLGRHAVQHAIDNGAKTLNAFDVSADIAGVNLPEYYSGFGFVETGRVPFDENQAPEGWDYDKYGRPDVVFMGLKGEETPTPETEEPSGPPPEDTAKFTQEVASREDLPREVREIASSDRYNFKLEESDEDGRESFSYGLKGAENWPSVTPTLKMPDGTVRQRRAVKYNPEIAEAVEISEEDGTRYEYKLKPGWSKTVEHNDPNMMYRGMSWEEWEEAKRTGYIQSKGDMNIGDAQSGLTYFSDNTGEASHYASSFAPERYSATPDRPAILVAVPKREGKQVGGTGRSEIGIEGQIPLSEVSRTWEGHPYYSGENGGMSVRQDWGVEGKSLGSASSLSSSIAWKESDAPAQPQQPVEQETQKPTETAGPSYEPYSEGFLEDEQKTYQGLRDWRGKVDASVSKFTGGEFNSLSEMKIPPSVLREAYVSGDTPEDGAFRAIMTHLSGNPYYGKDATPEAREKYPNMPTFRGYRPSTVEQEAEFESEIESAMKEESGEEAAPVETTAEEPAVEEAQPQESPTLGVDFEDSITDSTAVSSISNYASRSGLSISQPVAGRRDFQVTAEDGKYITIAANKKGELFMVRPGQKAEPFNEKEFISHFNPDDAFETVKMDKSKVKEGPSKPMKLGEKKPKAQKKNVDFDRKKKNIPWDPEKYGEVGARADGTPTPGFATWVLENLGYRPDSFGTVETKDDKGKVTKKKDPNQPIYSQEMINQVIRKYKGIAPKEPINLGETMKSIGLDNGRNVISGFLFGGKS